MLRNHEVLKLKTHPKATKGAVFEGDYYRFTVLTSRLIRMEYSIDGIFHDQATQSIICRNFEVPEYRVADKGQSLEILTEHLHLTFHKRQFSRSSLNVRLLGNLSNFLSVWYYGDKIDTLKGTARTLDGVNGTCELEDGVISKGGFSVLDDSSSLLLEESGWVAPARAGYEDLYFFGYGREYRQCLKDFYHLCGATPLLPRFTLGNWWSRFFQYTEESYQALIERFEQEKIPFSVAVIDMDWHLVDIDPTIGSGWTGYTWNRELFPNPAGFMDWLHQKGLKVTLNIHPADGIRSHEEMYPKMAEALGMIPEEKLPIDFDITNTEFLEAYFKYVSHPLEEDGVDFWWIDWQSGSTSAIEGVDPLWMLNHFHYLDSLANGKSGLTFSRYAGVGSHRYPIGFSGDSITTWESLAFQPYFTANAANIGYTWWSHDIGGHMMGYKDDELMVRWVQFGVFSPINRLHSSGSPFNGKEPFKYAEPGQSIIKKYLRLRHELVPYLYSMNYKCHYEGEALVRPVYYEDAWEESAYKEKNEYFFGSQLLVSPITKPVQKQTCCGVSKGWLPDGLWFDFFNGRVYKGNRYIHFHRPLSEMPVFAKAGAIIPLSEDGKTVNGVDNPESIKVLVYPGGNTQFDLYEDDGTHKEENVFTVTKLEVLWDEREFRIDKPVGDTGCIPNDRRYHVVFNKWSALEMPSVYQDGEKIMCVMERIEKAIHVYLPISQVFYEYRIVFGSDTIVAGNDYKKEVFCFLDQAQIDYTDKDKIWSLIENKGAVPEIVQELMAMELDGELIDAFSEILWAYEKGEE